MIQINIADNLKQAIGSLDSSLARQIPYAASVAINKTAEDIPPAMGKEAASVFDRPRPFTTGAGAMYVRRSNKTRLSAEVGYKDIQARYLKWEIAGGARVQKAFERALAGGGFLPSGYLTTPGAGIRLDVFGNIPRAQLAQILGQLKSGASVYAGRGKNVRREGLFIVLPGAKSPRASHLTPGIWRRIERGTERTAVPLIHYVAEATYRPRLDFEGSARKVVDSRFPAHFAAAWQQAVATAR